MTFDDEDDAALLHATERVSDRYAAFYRRHAGAVLRHLAARRIDAATAADVSAETFAAAYVARARYEERGGGARGWVLRIADRRLADQARRWSRERSALRRLALVRPQLTADDVADYDALVAAEAAIGRLPADQRDAIRARVVEGRPYAEVAELLGASEAAARKRVSRGLTELRQHLEDR